jgi:hypothetical protein
MLLQRPRRQAAGASRPPRTIVRSHPHRSPLCACGTAPATEATLPPRAECAQGQHAHTGGAKRRRLQDNRVSYRSFNAEPQSQTEALLALRDACLPEVTSNGEVEGPADASGRTQVERSSSVALEAAGRAPRAHTVFQRPRRQTDHASRTPRTCVRGTATAAKQSHPGHLALPHRAHARSSDVEQSPATNEAAKAQCSRPRSGATPASAAATGALIPGRFRRQCSSGAEAVAPTAAETKGSSKRVTGKDDELTSSTSPEPSL